MFIITAVPVFDPDFQSAENPGIGHVAAVLRALSILDAFKPYEIRLQLAVLARRTGLAKPTVLRLARTLAQAHYLNSLDGGEWRLGPAAVRLGERFQQAYDIQHHIEPALRALALKARCCAAFSIHGPDNSTRTLVEFGADGNEIKLTDAVHVSPDRCAATHVFRAYTGEAGPIAHAIRSRGFHLSVGDLDSVASSMASPVLAASGNLVGVISISASPDKQAADRLLGHSSDIAEAAARLSQRLSVSWIHIP